MVSVSRDNVAMNYAAERIETQNGSQSSKCLE